MTDESPGIQRSLLFLIAVASVWTLASAARADEVHDPAIRDYLSGNGLLNRGLYELAIEDYRKFLREHEDHEKAPVARYGLSVSLFRLQRFEQALPELDRLWKRKGFEFAAEVSTMSGQAHLAVGQTEKAVAAFRETVTRHGEHDLAGAAASGLVESLYRQEEFAAALEVGRDFAARWPDNPLRERVEFFSGLCEMAAGDYEAAAARYTSFLNHFDRGPFAEQVSLLLARCHRHNGSIDAAVDQYRKLLTRASDEFVPEALLALGGLLYEKGSYEEAATTLDRMLNRYKTDPNAPRAVFQRALVYFAQEKFKHAYKAFQVAEEFDESTADRSAYWAGKCKMHLEEFDKAARHLERSYEKYPGSSLAPLMVYDRAVALLRGYHAESALEALRFFKERFEDHQLAPSALHLAAATLHNRQDFSGSAKMCADFAARFGEHSLAPAMALLAAENDFFAGSYEDAVEGYRALLKKYGSDERSELARLRLATSLYRLERFEEAEPLLESVAALADGDPLYRPALLGLGDILFQRGEWERAEKRLDAYLSFGLDQPSADDALLKRGLSRQRQEKLAAARTDYEALLDQFAGSPHRLQARFELGQVLVALQDPRAAETFDAVLAEGGDSRFGPHALDHLAAIAMKSGEFETAARLYQQAGESQHAGALAPDLLFRRAQSLMAAKDYAAAERTLSDFAARYGRDERSGQARGQLVLAIARQDRCDDALKAFDRLPGEAVSRLEDSLAAAIRYERAWCLGTTGKPDEAAAGYRAILEGIAPDDTRNHALLELGEILAEQGDFEQAAKVLRELRERLASAGGDLSALREPATYRLAVCEFELGRFDEAAELFEEFVGAFKESKLAASACFFAGEAWYKLGRHDRSAQHMVRVIEEFDDQDLVAPAMLRVGESSAALHRWSASEQSLSAYLARFGDSDVWYQARFGRGWAREHQKRYEEAIADYRAVVDGHKGPTAARAQFQVGQCLFAQKDFGSAVRELLKVDILYAYPQWSGAALYEAGRCFEKLGKPAEAQAQFRQVTEKFEQTEWAELAAKRLRDVATASALPGP